MHALYKQFKMYMCTLCYLNNTICYITSVWNDYLFNFQLHIMLNCKLVVMKMIQGIHGTKKVYFAYVVLEIMHMLHNCNNKSVLLVGNSL
jgi:hypothetical protein